MSRVDRCERGVNGCGYRSYGVKWGIVIRFSITPDPKTIVKQAGVSKYAASNTAEAPKFTFTSLDHYCERGVHGCEHRSYRVSLSIVTRSSITLDPKTIAKQAGVSKYAASNTVEGAQIYCLTA